VGGQIGIGENVSAVQSTFKKIFNRDDLYTDGRQFDRLFADGEAFSVGNVEAHVLSTPGHTPACVTYVIGDAAFVGDTLFMPDYGTARCDFPDGSAATLFDSIQKIFSLPANTRLFMCHDYKAPGRVEFAWETSVEEQRNQNIHVNDRVARDDFVQMRNRRDAELNLPALILPSIQVNLCAGELPDAEANDIRYLQIPLDTF
jgi:glyoxylase-like metal-dependent hydrolase (beta-lactamase superfamily II)